MIPDGHTPDAVEPDTVEPDVAEPDVVVVGGGAAGLSAATTVAAAGGRVLLVSAGPLGGDCTWHGCVPTTAFLEAVAAGTSADAALQHAARCVTRLARLESPGVLERAGVRVVRTRAVLRSDGGAGPVVHADEPGGGEVWRPRLGVVLATGSRPVGSAPGLDALPADVRVATTEGWQQALGEHLQQPDRGGVVVLGGGPSGVELAQGLARGGEPVTLLERSATLLPTLPGAGEVVAAALAHDGVRVVCGVGAADVRAVTGPRSLVLLATGRVPVLDALTGWDGPDLASTSSGVTVDAAMRTTAPRLVAAGDVTGLLRTTHVAAATGRVAAATLLGRAAAFDPRWAPRVVYGDPEVAAVGDLDGPRHVRVPLSRVDRSVLADLPTGPATGPSRRPRGGFVRLWAGADLRVRGALLVTPHAGELVAEVALVGRLGLTVQEWVAGLPGVGATAAHQAYPSWSWVWREAADRLLGR